MDTTVNLIVLRGTLASRPEFSHENHGRRFYRFFLDAPRLSGTVDTLQIIAAQEILERTTLDGEVIQVVGQVRSFNNRSDTGRKLVISVYAEDISLCDDEPENAVEITGTICKAPVYRKTPLGREICDVMLAVNRSYHRSDYLPVILWGRTAKEVAPLPVGSVLNITGRLQSREYLKVLESGTERRTAYEISAMSAEILSAPAAQTEEG